ncbi:MAG: DMT family transporter [bacterium]|nr:DMT family transporter [bacterium]
MKNRSIIYLLIFALMIAMGHILQKIVLNHGVDRFVFAFIRIATGFIFITLLLLKKKYKPIPIIKKNIRHFIVLGIGFSGFGILLKLWGLSHTTATNAAFIMSLSSVAVVIFALLLLKEKARKGFYVTVLLMIGGVYLVTTGGKQLLPQTGDIIIFGLAFLIGFMRVYGKKVLETLSVLETAFGRSLVGMIFLGLLIPIFSPRGFATIPDIFVLLLVIANGLTFSSSILLFYKALQVEGASNAAMFSLLAPVFTAGLGYAFLGEMLNIYQVIGGAVILGGSLLISRFKIKQANF